MVGKTITIGKKNEFELYKSILDLTEYNEKMDCRLVQEKCHDFVMVRNSGIKCVNCYKLYECVDGSHVHHFEVLEDGSKRRCTKCGDDFNGDDNFDTIMLYANDDICKKFDIVIEFEEDSSEGLFGDD